MDVHIPRAITLGLRQRAVDVLTAQEDGADTLPDPVLLSRAGSLSRVLFSFDEDLVIEAQRRQSEGIEFAGLIFTRPLRISIGRCVEDLELIAKACGPDELRNRVLFLPLG
jgi:hypothetical protein